MLKAKKKKSQLEKIDLLLESVLAERGYLVICKEYDVVARWKEIAGPKLSTVTECNRVEDGILYVKVSSASWRQEITYFKKQLIDKVREVTGCTTIKEIVFC